MVKRWFLYGIGIMYIILKCILSINIQGVNKIKQNDYYHIIFYILMINITM
jgi:hypothetical protein